MLNETPISILQSKINTYEGHIARIENKDGIYIPTIESQEKVDKFVADLHKQITIFENAITALKESSKSIY